MKIKDIMLKPILIRQEASKKELLEIAKKNKNMPIFMVVDDDNKFLGDIHENDLFYMVIPNKRYKDIGAELEFNLEKKFFAKTAKEIMRKHDLICSPDESIIDAALKLASVEINEMPVIDKKGRVIGVITQGLLLRHL